MRVLKWTAIGLAAALAAAVIAITLVLRGSLPRLDDEAIQPILRAPVTIERDALGVATIRGTDRAEVAFGLGYAHAQDRYFQMDLARRMAAGRLAEVFGDAALPVDRAHRLHGFEGIADRVLATMPSAPRALLDMYTAGANAGLASLRVRPFEYVLMRARPAPWQTRDALLVAYAMFLQLNDDRAGSDRQRGLIRAVLPEPMFRFIYAVAPEWEAPVAGLVAAAVATPTPGEYDLRAHHADFARLASALPVQTADRVTGSNNWAVAGSHTASGAGLLANDMHLGLGVPNTWYRARLVVKGPAARDVVGVTLPGLPMMVVGSNGKLAWGYTNSYGDFSDLVLIERSADGSKYLSRSGWTAFTHRIETLRSSSGRSETLDVALTEWGPVLEPGADGQTLALRWTAHEPDAINFRLIEFETLRSVEEALALAPLVGTPVQNLVCADAAGNIGWTLIGRVPARGSAYEAGVPSKWTAPDAGWQGWLAPAEYPRVMNPANGRLWTANNRVVGGEMLQRIGDGAPDRGARAQQIRDGLLALPAATERDMLALQLDERALFLERWRALALAWLTPDVLAGHPERAELQRVLATGAFAASVESSVYRLTRDLHERIGRHIFEALTVEVRARYPDQAMVVPRHFEAATWQLVNEQPANLLDPRYGSWREFQLAMIDETIAEARAKCPGGLATCRWGERNAVRIQHPLSRAVPALARWLDMPVVPMGGANDMPHVHSPAFGASERFAVSPGREAQGYFHMPGGQSGHPLSPYYRAGHEAWVRGEATPFLPGPPAHEFVLRPESSVAGP